MRVSPALAFGMRFPTMSRRTPHDSEPVASIWTAWPHHPDWKSAKDAVRAELAAFVDALCGGGPQIFAPPEPVLADAIEAGLAPREGLEPALVAAPGPVAAEPPQPDAPPPEVVVLARKADHADIAARLEALREGLGNRANHRPRAGRGRSRKTDADAARPIEPSSPTLMTARFGDIWLRDTGPVFTLTADGPRAVAFGFNGWGGKYVYRHDDTVAAQIARALDMGVERADMVCEGGALETDGEGAAIVTRACLLDRARNPSFDAGDAERELRRTLGFERLIWLEEGLMNDHTDGHADTLARFVRPGLVVCQAPNGPHDPNAKTLDDVARALDRARDAQGRPIDVVRVPSPGLVRDEDGAPLPASHMNFVHAGGRVLAPVYGSGGSEAVTGMLSQAFDGKDVLPLPADALITGGGAFHCVTCAVPAPGVRL